MSRKLPPLVEFAAEVAHRIGGSPRILDSGEYGSAAIELHGRHPLLIREHNWSLTLSFPIEGSWQVQTREEWQAVERPIMEALAKGSQPVSMSDAVVAFAPVVARLTGSAWSVSFPGTPVPQEAWMKHESQSVGLFQEADGVRIVVWVGGSMRSKSVHRIEQFGPLEEWLAAGLGRQEGALLAAEAEAKRQAALPLPDYDAVVALLRSGARIRTSGGRYSETYFWDTRLRRDIFDEGESYVEDGSEEQLRSSIRLYSAAFREALEAGPQK